MHQPFLVGTWRCHSQTDWCQISGCHHHLGGAYCFVHGATGSSISDYFASSFSRKRPRWYKDWYIIGFGGAGNFGRLSSYIGLEWHRDWGILEEPVSEWLLHVGWGCSDDIRLL